MERQPINGERMAAGLARFHAAGAKVHANGPMDQVLHAAQMVMDYAEAARSFLWECSYRRMGGHRRSRAGRSDPGAERLGNSAKVLGPGHSFKMCQGSVHCEMFTPLNIWRPGHK